MEKELYSEKFWFEQHHLHGEVFGYDKRYYANHLYECLVKKINDIPSNGYIVVLGSNNCVSMQILVDHFGSERCLGIDISNPKNHPLVKVKNILEFETSDNIPIAFVHNDLGSYPHTPIAKIAAQMWAAKNIIDNGYMLSRNNLNSAKFPAEEYMDKMGFLNVSLSALTGFVDFKSLDKSIVEGHMLSKKCKPEIWDSKK
jgi:hypothetical protein